MQRHQARRLVLHLNRVGRSRKGVPACTASVVGACIVFKAPSGKHSVSYAEQHGGLTRVLIHWRGFCETNGHDLPARSDGTCRYTCEIEGNCLDKEEANQC